MLLSRQLKQTLTAKAHKIKPVVIIGSNGLTENVLTEIDHALEAHELIKIRVNANDRDERAKMTNQICTHAKAHLIQAIGHIIAIYKKKQQ
jgi:RNA-binding protein